MPYIGDDAMETLDIFMTSIGRKGAWELLKKKLSSLDDCQNDGCAEAITQTKINKDNIATNSGNIAELKNTVNNLNNLVIEGIDKADPDDVDDWFNDNE